MKRVSFGQNKYNVLCKGQAITKTQISPVNSLYLIGITLQLIVTDNQFKIQPKSKKYFETSMSINMVRGVRL